jgi:hypothetical protein
MGDNRDFRKPPPPLIPPRKPEDDPEKTPIDGSAAYEFRLRKVEQTGRQTTSAITGMKTEVTGLTTEVAGVKTEVERVHTRLDGLHDTLSDTLIKSLGEIQTKRATTAVDVQAKQQQSDIDITTAKKKTRHVFWMSILGKLTIGMIGLAIAAGTLLVESWIRGLLK